MTVTTDSVSPVLGGPLAEFLAETIPRVARNANRRYRYVPAEDYEQTLWLAALSRPHRYAEPFREGKLWAVTKRLRETAYGATKEDQRFRRAKAAAEAGYSTDDIEFYSTGLLARVLPALIEANFDTGEAMQRASSGTDAAGVFIRSNDPFSGAENYMVMLADITGAWKRLPEGQRRLLTAYYGTRQDDSEDGRWERERLASSMGLTADALRQRAYRGLSRLQDELGGADPWK